MVDLLQTYQSPTEFDKYVRYMDKLLNGIRQRQQLKPKQSSYNFHWWTYHSHIQLKIKNDASIN